MLSKVAPNLVKESRAHNAEVAQTTLNISKTVFNYSKDATLDNLNKYSFGSLGKHFETINQASQRQQEQAEQIYNWGTTQLKEGKQAYLTADSNAQAKQAKVVIDIATVVVPFTKASTLNKGLKVADGLADLSKLETSTVKLTQNAFNKTITDLNYARKAEGGVELSFNMKVEPPKSAYAQQPQLNVPTQITPKVTIHPLEQHTPIGKIKAAEQTLFQITKDALEKGEISLKPGKELEFSMKLKPREHNISKAVHVEEKISEVENIVKVPDGVPLTQKQVDEIVAIPKGQRPDPSEYLPKDYIDQHLELFKDGGSRIVSEEKFNKYGLSQVDGTTFVLPKNEVEDILKHKIVTTEDMEKFLGLPAGQLEYSGSGAIKIDIPYNSKLNLRVPSGNEAGANSQWIPGGKLPLGGE